MKRLFQITIIGLFLTFALSPSQAQAQLLGGPGGSDTFEESDDQDQVEDSDSSATSDDSEGFTGTYSDEDPDSEAFKEKQLFGEEEEADPEDEDNTFDNQGEGPTHSLKFEFDGQLAATNIITEVTYLEINYQIKIEQEVEVKNARFRSKAQATILTEVVGDYAANELFSCVLDIQFGKETPVESMIRYRTTPATEEEDAKAELAVKFNMKKSDFMEDWFSNCTGVDGSIFNTQGDKEKYLYLILENVLPELSGFLMENFEYEGTNTTDHQAEAFIIEDPDAYIDYTLTGSGTTVVEPLE